MPEGFDSCEKNGGKIKTKKMSGGKYMHICFLNGKSYAGDVKTGKTTAKATKGAFIRSANKV